MDKSNQRIILYLCGYYEETLEKNYIVKIMEQYKEQYPDWFDKEGNYIIGSKENRIERIKDSIRAAKDAESYGNEPIEDVDALLAELAELEGRTISYNDKVNLLIRQRYSLSEELAVLRQREEKPAEYQQYYEYCEQCKTKVKGL